MKVKSRVWAAILGLTLFSAAGFAQTTEPVWKDRVNEGRDLLATDPKRGEELLRSEAERLEKQFAGASWNAELIQRAGMAYFYLAQNDKAQAAFAKALRLDPKNPGFHFMAGRIHSVEKRWVQASIELEACVKIDPKMTVAWMQLGRVYIELKKPDDAIRSLQKVIELTPDDPKAYARLGEAQLQKDARGPEAIASFERAIAIDPNDAVSWSNLGQSHQNRREPAEALKAFSEAARLRPDEWRVQAKLVQCYAALNDVAARDAAIAGVRKLNDQGKVKADYFCRDQFDHAGVSVMAFESFKLTGEQLVKYAFRILDETGQTQYRISLGSYDSKVAREPVEASSGQRVWHLDGFYANDETRTYAMMNAEPTFDQVKSMIIDILDGKLKEISTSKPSTTQPGTVEINVPEK